MVPGVPPYWHRPSWPNVQGLLGNLPNPGTPIRTKFALAYDVAPVSHLLGIAVVPRGTPTLHQVGTPPSIRLAADFAAVLISPLQRLGWLESNA
jgi:hypothetical protein